MELQPPQSPIITTISQKSEDKKLDDILLQISEKINLDTEKKRESDKELKILLSTLSKKLDDTSNPLIINVKALKDIEELQQKNTQLSKQIKELSNKHQSFISTNNQDRQWLSFAFLSTALGLSINFIMFAYLWYHTHK